MFLSNLDQLDNAETTELGKITIIAQERHPKTLPFCWTLKKKKHKKINYS